MAGGNIKLTISFNDPELDAEEQDEEARKLLSQLKEMDEVRAGRISDLDPPDGSKPGGGFLVGLLMAEVNSVNFKKLMAFLGDRLGGKPIELEVEGNGKKLKLTAHSREELVAAVKAAQDFIEI